MSSVHLPPGPSSPPIIGWRVHALPFFADMARWSMEWYRQYGTLVSIGAGAGGAVLAFGSEHNRHVFTATDVFHTLDAQTFPVPLPRGSALFRAWSNGLLQMNGSHHDQQRRLMMPAFHRKRLEGYRADMIALAERKLADWKPGQVRPILTELRELTAFIAIQTLIGLNPAEEGAALLGMFEQWSGSMQSPKAMALPFNLPGLPFHRLIQLSEQMEQEMSGLIARKKGVAESGTDALSALIMAEDDDGRRLSDAELIGQATTLFVAGHETTASAMTWTLLMLSQHPQVLSDLMDELAPLNGNPPDMDNWNQFPLLEGVIHETLRLFPPLPAVIRVASEPFHIGGYDFPAGTNVVLSAFVTHRMPELFSQPDSFLPERWRDISPSAYEYIPFSSGSRMCLGSAFAMTEMKIVLPMILSRYQLSPPPGARVDYSASIFLTPRHGLPMTIQAQTGHFRREPIHGSLLRLVDLPQ